MPNHQVKKSVADTVADALRIALNELGPGRKAPSYREVMREHGVSQTSVAAAHRKLLAEGLIEVRKGQGVFTTSKLAKQSILLMCESAAFVSSSPFWEMLLEAIAAIFKDRSDQLETVFTIPFLERRETVPIRKFLPNSLWQAIAARRFSCVMTVCVDERVNAEIGGMGVPIIAFGGKAQNHIGLDFDDACRQGVREMMRLGCKKIAIYNVPSISIQQLYQAALSVPGARDCLLPPQRVFQVHQPQLGYRSRKDEHGFREAQRLFDPATPEADRPDGIFSIDDKFTLGVLLALERLGMKPGRDVQVASHTNKGSGVLLPWSKEITILEFDPWEVASALVIAADCIVQGRSPDRGGWERSSLAQTEFGVVRSLDILPRLVATNEV